MARQITVLEQESLGGGTRIVHGVFWFPVAAGPRQVPRPGLVSKATAVTTQEQTDLEAGLTREEPFAIEMPAGYPVAPVKALLQARYTDRAAAILLEQAARNFYGVTFDSVTGWSA